MIHNSQLSGIITLFPALSCVPRECWRSAQIVTVSPSTPHVVREGRLLEHAMFILDGPIRIYKLGLSGKEVTLYRIGPGESCALMMASLLGQIPYEASAGIETESQVLLIPAPVFRSWMNEYEMLRQWIYRQIMQRITSVTQVIENIAFRSIPSRLADHLLICASSSGSTLYVTHEQLAAELGTAREVISRTLKDFADKGALVLGRKQVTILNRDELQRILKLSY
jgi:cAMP-binding proteins - catabolite gene activator and regulatory subunit of cAMP-dependent protein kinases